MHLCYDSRQHKQRAAIRMLRSRERASNLKVELAILLRMQSERHALPKVLHAARREILLMSTALKIAASCGSLACLEDIMKIYASCAIPLPNLPQSNCSVLNSNRPIIAKHLFVLLRRFQIIQSILQYTFCERAHNDRGPDSVRARTVP